MSIPVRSYNSLLMRYLRPQGRRVALLALLLGCSISLQLVAPQILRSFIDLALAGAAMQPLALRAVLFMLAILVNQPITAYAQYVGEDVSWTATNALRADIARHALRLDMAFHKAHNPGELIERIDGDVGTLSGFFSQFVIKVLANGVLVLGVVILLCREDWRVGLALGLFAAGSVVLLFRVRDLAVPLFKAEREGSAELFGFVEERLSGTEDIRANGTVPYVLRRLEAKLRTLYALTHRSAMAWGGTWALTQVLFTLADGLGLGLGVLMWRWGVVSIGTVYLIYNYTQSLRRPIDDIRIQMQELQRAGGAIVRIQELLAQHPQVVDGPGADLPSGAAAVTFAGVTFGYEPGEPVLQDVSFDLRPGQVLGLLGRTGSGKTTISRLLLRFYDPESGEVRLGGVPLTAFTQAQLRQKVGMVTQDVQLMNASIRDNITFFDAAIPDDRVREVLTQVGLGDWLAQKPDGLETELEPGGLSAGEAQLLAFARVFLADPALVILDEATSRLDPATERLIERAVDKLLQGRTGVIIAHRLATVERADAILILEEGRVLEMGAREALRANPDSRFSQLLRQGLEVVLS